MQAIDYLRYIVEQIHSTVFATVDAQGRPVTCAIDMMDCDEDGLYFLTAKGKSFYRRLQENGNVAFTAMKGEDTLSCVAVSVQGKARELGTQKIPELFAKNPYMEKIYPDPASRSALTVFRIEEGTGEWFDLSKLPIERASFSFGGGRLLCDRPLHRLQALLLQMPAEVHRHQPQAGRYPAGALSARRQLYGGLPGKGGGTEGIDLTQEERLTFLLDYLLRERQEKFDVPADPQGRRQLLRALMNVRMPAPVSDEFLGVQDAYLQEETRRKGITDLQELEPVEPGIYLWQGDITTLRCDAIVNAANSQMLGCFVPCHGCIDNAIHSFAGVQLRLACQQLMQRQGHEEGTGEAKITPAFNLPCRYVLHTVGPIITGRVTGRDCQLLASCYRSCLELAERSGCRSVAFCCISTGEFHFPNRLAAQIAVETVRAYRQEQTNPMEVIFNVFQDQDHAIYRQLLG